jgi:competence protein ComEC
MKYVQSNGPRALLLWATLIYAALCAQGAKTLDIYFIDVEGGQSTLIVSPSGQSLLVDTGFAGNSGRDATRIAQAAKLAGVKRIDYLMITHHHADHVGGVENLLARLPVGAFLDHGPSVELDGKYDPPYAAAIAKAQHQVLSPGDKIPVKGLDITVVGAGGKAIAGKGAPNEYCKGVAPHEEGAGNEKGENPQSLAIVVEFGKFRFADLGDITWNKQLALLCPENKVGKVDLYLAAHHTTETLNAIWALAPRVTVSNNGARKGGNPADWKIVKASPGLEDLWQLHFAAAGGKETNVPDPFIANVEDYDEGHYLKATVAEDGSFTMFNPRNKYMKRYGVK